MWLFGTQRHTSILSPVKEPVFSAVDGIRLGSSVRFISPSRGKRALPSSAGWRLPRDSERETFCRVFYAVQIRDLVVLELRSPDQIGTVGLSPGDLVDTRWDACQAVAEAAHFLNYQGIVAPSATGVGLVVTVFADRGIDSLKIIDSEVVESN